MKTNNIYIVSSIVGVFLFGGMVILSLPNQPTNEGDHKNITSLEGKQVIEIKAKGGYSPRNNSAKADMPTVLKVKTMGTFDCSASLNIPSIGYQNYLPNSGETLIEIPPQKAGSTMQGVCGMGMYNFSINFS